MPDDADPLYYDPYDFTIDDDPYPMWRRLREEAPLYRNDRYDFWAVSRFDDVEAVLLDWRRFRSGRGSVLEVIRSGIDPPSGFILFEDPPAHDVHRGLLARVFTPRRMNAIEPELHRFCAETLDPHRGEDTFDFVRDLGAYMPMRAIGMLLGIPQSDQEAIREAIDASLRLDESGAPGERTAGDAVYGGLFGEYVDWRVEHPSDDLMSELVHAEFEDEHGVRRKLRRDEALGYIGLLASAGNETTTRLIGWTGKLLADHPDQRARLVADPSLTRGAIEEILRYEAPSPVQARLVAEDVELHGVALPEGSVVLAINGAANRDERRFPEGERFDVTRRIDHHLTFGFGLHFCLGAALARLEGRVALEAVLARWPEWEIDSANAVRARTSTVRGWERLPAFVTPAAG